MARARNIKPGFFKNEDLAECSFAARLCFAGLWTLADREGRLEDRPKRIKGELFPFDTIDVEGLLLELERFNFIVRYETHAMKAIQIREFKRHQSPHYSENASVIKPPELQESPNHREPSTSRALQEHSKKTPRIKRGSQPPDSLNPSSLNPDSLKVSTTVERAPGEPTPPPTRTKRAAKKAPADFDITAEMMTWATQNAPGVNVETETATFLDHEFATPRTDWLGTWRNWMRKAQGFAPRNGNGTHHAAALPWQDTKDGVINRACALVLREYDGIEPWERYRRHVIEEDAKRRQAA